MTPPVDADPPADDLAWLAFAYATGDLPADEEAPFEDRLGTDQHARDALAAAVALVATLHDGLHRDSIQQPPRPAPATAPAARRGWLAPLLTLTVCVAVAAGWSLLSRWRPAGAGAALVNSTSADPSPEVALAWSRMRQTLADESDGRWEAADPSAEPTPAAAPDEEVAAPDDNADVPAWLLTAVRLEGDGAEDARRREQG
jgi:hypothetical protein